MEITINVTGPVHVYPLSGAFQTNTNATLAKIVGLLTELTAQEKKMAATLDQVLKDVTDEGTVIESVSTLVSGIAAQLKAAKGDQVKIDAILAQVDKNKAAIAAAIVAGTPADDGTTTTTAADTTPGADGTDTVAGGEA